MKIFNSSLNSVDNNSVIFSPIQASYKDFQEKVKYFTVIFKNLNAHLIY